VYVRTFILTVFDRSDAVTSSFFEFYFLFKLRNSDSFDSFNSWKQCY